MLDLDPEYFPIEQQKTFGIWPSNNIASIGISPYVKRLGENVTVLDVGCMKGENAYHLLHTCPNISMVYGVECFEGIEDAKKERMKSLLQTNLGGNLRFTLAVPNDLVDVVCIDVNSNIDVNLETYYAKLKVGGIFAGNEHHLGRVKEALVNFRRKSRIGTPINVSNGAWFWVKR